MKATKKSRQRIDAMIDAHVWMRRAARIHGEWPTHEGTSILDKAKQPTDAGYISQTGGQRAPACE